MFEQSLNGVYFQHEPGNIPISKKYGGSSRICERLRVNAKACDERGLWLQDSAVRSLRSQSSAVTNAVVTCKTYYGLMTGKKFNRVVALKRNAVYGTAW